MPHKKEEIKGELYGDAVREKLEEFAEQGWEAIPEDEREEWFSRFKFWGVFHHRGGQESYFMMRLTNCGGILEPDQLRAIGEVARDYAKGPAENPEFGNGWIDLTTRQSIQLHWLKLEDIPEIWEKLEAVGVSSRSAGGDTMRNISGCPVAGKAEEYVESRPILDEIQETIREDDDLCNMPRKFNISVTGCRQGCAQDSINDIGLEPAHKFVDGEEVEGYNVRVGGGLSRNEPRLARDIDVFVTPEQATDVAGGMSGLFRDHGDRENRYNARIKFLVDEWGTEKMRNVLQEEYVDFELHSAGEDYRDEYSYNAGVDHGHADHVGVHEQADGNYYVGLNVLVGRMGADEVIELADIADEYGSGEARVTQRQNVILTDVPEENLDALLEEPLLETYEPDPHPFMRGSIACTGTEFCSLSIVETKNRQVRYARWLKDNVELPDDLEDFHVHLSGCTASCAQPQIADVSLRGMKTRKDGEPVEALDIGLGGGLGENPEFASWVTERVPADEVPGAIKNLVANYAELREGGETFREFVVARDDEELAELVEPEETSYDDPFMHNTKQTWYPYAEDDGLDDSPAPATADGEPLPSDD